MENINWARFWGVFYVMMLTAYTIRIFLWKKGIARAKAGLSDKFIVIGLMPYLFYRMWQYETLSMNEKAITSILGISAIIAGIIYLIFSWRKVENSQDN